MGNMQIQQWEKSIKKKVDEVSLRCKGSSIFTTISDKITKYRNFEKPSKLDWFAFAMIAMFFFAFVANYGDYVLTLKLGVLADEALFHGEIFNYYQYVLDSIQAGYALAPATWELPAYLFLGVFLLPVYLVKELGQFDLLSTVWGLLYGKVILIYITYLCAKGIRRIIETVTEDSNLGQWAFFLFFSSIQVYLHCFGIGRFDIIPTLALIKMLEFAILEEKRKFLFWSILGVTLKSFALFLFIPIVLFYCKSLWKIVMQIVICLSGLLACMLIYHGNSAFIASGAIFKRSMLSNLIQSHTFPVYVGLASLVITSLVIIYCYAYAHDASKTDKKYNLKCINYFGLAVFYTLFLFMGFHPNWIIILVPFSIINLFTQKNLFKLNLILDIGIYMILSVAFIYVQPATYGSNNFDCLLFPKMFNYPIGKNYTTFFEFLGIETRQIVFTILMGLYLGMVICFLVANFPRKSESHNSYLTMQEIKSNKGLIFTRTIIMVFYIAIILIPAIKEKPINELLIDFSKESSKIENTFNDDVIIEQTVENVSRLKVNRIKVSIVSDPVKYPQYDAATISIKLLDVGRKPFFEKEINNTSFENGSYEGGWVSLDVNKIDFSSHQRFIIQISIKNADYNDTWGPMVSDRAENLSGWELTLNGVKQEKVLALQIYGTTTKTLSENLNSQIVEKSAIRNENQEVMLTVTMRNIAEAWSERQRIHLGFGINGMDMQHIRGVLSPVEIVDTNETRQYTVNLGILSDDVVVAFQMVEEGVRWFGERDEFEIGSLLRM